MPLFRISLAKGKPEAYLTEQEPGEQKRA